MYTNMLDIILLNGSVIVDVFFVAAGSLLSWTILGYTQRGKRLSMLHIFAYRYLRWVFKEAKSNFCISEMLQSIYAVWKQRPITTLV